MRRCLLLAASLCLSAVAAPARAISLSAAFESERERRTDIPARGFSAGLSQDFGDYFFGGVSYSRLVTDPFTAGTATGREEYTTGGVDLGAGYSFTEWFAATVSAGYARTEVRGRDGFADAPASRSDGPAGSLILSFRPHSRTELFFGPAYSYLGREPAWQANVGLGFEMLPGLWISAGFWGAASKYGGTAGLRFGN